MPLLQDHVRGMKYTALHCTEFALYYIYLLEYVTYALLWLSVTVVAVHISHDPNMLFIVYVLYMICIVYYMYYRSQLRGLWVSWTYSRRPA